MRISDSENYAEVAEKFYSKLQQTDIFYYFKQICKVDGDRVMKMQISMVHMKSSIRCLVLFRENPKIIESTEIIERFAADPLCKNFPLIFITCLATYKYPLFFIIINISGNYLITYIRTWQMKVNQLGMAHFDLNTYIISVLIIFFLQVNHEFPTVDGATAIHSSNSDFKPILRHFFNFYGNQYDILKQVISTHIGQRQSREIQSQQNDLTPAQIQFVSFLAFNFENSLLNNFNKNLKFNQ